MTAGSANLDRLSTPQITVAPEKVLTFPRTDSQRREGFPTNTREVVNRDGIYDFLKPLDQHDYGHFAWRKKIGAFLAKGDKREDFDECIIEDFPAGYELFDHHKGPPGGAIRHDLYLYGGLSHKTGKAFRFRSVPEFLPHAQWLYDQQRTEPCKCKYCVGAKYQREITANLDVEGLLHVGNLGRTHSPRASSVAGPSRRKPKEHRLTVPRRPIPVSHTPAPAKIEPKEYVDDELRRDLRSGRPYRYGEVVWCAINPPLVDPRSTERITQWPGVIVDIIFKPSYDPLGGLRPETYSYHVEYLCTSQSEILTELEILPLQGYHISTSLAHRLERYRPAPGSLFEDCRQQWNIFRPLAKTQFDEFIGEPPVFEDGIPAYIAAFRTSDRVSSLYGMDVPWNQHANSMTQTTRSSGPPSVFAGQELYQGMWHGPERIWIGELVRLKPTRSQLPEDVQKCILPPAPEEHKCGRPVLFMYIDVIHRDPRKTGQNGGLKITGTLYEAVSLDWTEPGDEFGPLRSSAAATSSQIHGAAPLSKSASPTVVDSPAHAPANPPTTSTTLTAPKPVPTTSDRMIDHYPLPPPPPHSKWRPILFPQMDIRIPADLIAGRYYPSILEHPAAEDIDSQLVDQVLAGEPNVSGSMSDAALSIMCLGGLERSWYTAGAGRLEDGLRIEMLQRAQEFAEHEVWGYFQAPVNNPDVGSSNPQKKDEHHRLPSTPTRY